MLYGALKLVELQEPRRVLVAGDAVQQEVVCEMVALEAGDVDRALLHLPRRQRLQSVLRRQLLEAVLACLRSEHDGVQ